MDISNLEQYLKGHFTKAELIKFLTLFSALGFLFLFLAWLTYPPENNYSIMKDTISFLGSSDPDNNPHGWWLFSISLIIFAIMLVPIAFYRYRRMKKVFLPFALFSLLFYIIAAVGLFLVAIFPDNGGMSYFSDLSAGRLHNLVSIFAFGGFGLAFLIDLFTYIIDAIKKPMLFNIKIWGMVYIIFFILLGIAVYTQIRWNMICEANCWPGEGIYSFPLWEWIIFFTIFFVLYMTTLSLPNQIENKH